MIEELFYLRGAPIILDQPRLFCGATPRGMCVGYLTTSMIPLHQILNGVLSIKWCKNSPIHDPAPLTLAVWGNTAGG